MWLPTPASRADRPAAASAPIKAGLLARAVDERTSSLAALIAPVWKAASARLPVEPSALVKLPVPTTVTSPFAVVYEIPFELSEIPVMPSAVRDLTSPGSATPLLLASCHT